MPSNRTTLRWLRYLGVLVAVTLLRVHAANAVERSVGSKDRSRPADVAPPQVLLEMRIVDASRPFLRSLGIQRSGDLIPNPGHSNSMGLVFPNILSSADGSQSLTDEGRRNFVVNMPTVVGSGAGGGPFFGLASDTERLTRRLATAELDGLLKSVSVSNATTVDHSPTTMSQNVRIPFGVVSAGNGNSDAIDDRIVATVMPQVIADGSVLMQITINATNQLTRVNGSTGQWPLFSREWSVRMLVKPGSTMAIGGLVTHCIIESDCEVPLYSRIPLIGRLIRDLLRPEPKDPCVEVMMFVTPRIINRAQSVVSSTDP